MEGAVAGPVVHMTSLSQIAKRFCDFHLQCVHADVSLTAPMH